MASSESRKRFKNNFSDMDHLIDLYDTVDSLEEEEDDFTGHKAVILKSSIVLMVSHWEAYVEDICTEAINHLINNLEDSSKLPKSLKKQISKEILNDKNELRMWDLSGNNWKNIVSERLDSYRDKRNWTFNSPKSNQVITFFKDHIGIEDVSKGWKHKDMAVSACKKKLDEIVEVRGAIAHRGQPPKSITRDLAREYASFLKSIIAKTGGSVNAHIKRTCGTEIY